MYIQDYFGFLIAMLVCMALSAMASARVSSTFKKFDKVRASSGMTGYDTVRRLMQANNVQGISIGKVSGQLTDHYHPAKRIINLSDATYSSSSVAAVAVAAHEMGHVMQKKSHYLFYNLRTALVPVVNIGSFLAMPLVLLGLVLDSIVRTATPEMGFQVAMLGVLLYGGSLVFALVTLPVELNASRRAKQMLRQEGIVSDQQLSGADKVLDAAAMTYLASLVTSAVYFLRFALYVMTLFGRRRD